MTTYKEKISARELELPHVLVASLLSGFSEVGALNQAVVNNMMRKLAERIRAWLELHEKNPGLTPEDGVAGRVGKVFALLNEELRLVGDYRVEADGERAVLSIESGRCRICPVGVGEAEIRGTACPFPALVRNLVNLYAPDARRVQTAVQNRGMLVKQGGRCWIRYEWAK